MEHIWTLESASLVEAIASRAKERTNVSSANKDTFITAKQMVVIAVEWQIVKAAARQMNATFAKWILLITQNFAF